MRGNGCQLPDINFILHIDLVLTQQNPLLFHLFRRQHRRGRINKDSKPARFGESINGRPRAEAMQENETVLRHGQSRGDDSEIGTNGTIVTRRRS